MLLVSFVIVDQVFLSSVAFSACGIVFIVKVVFDRIVSNSNSTCTNVGGASTLGYRYSYCSSSVGIE